MQLIKSTAARISLLLLTLLVSVITFAQEGGGGEGADIKVDINKDESGGWYTNPIVWVVGAAIFILLLVALLRGNRSSD